jgi:phosphoglucomutase/phosphomannomutase
MATSLSGDALSTLNERIDVAESAGRISATAVVNLKRWLTESPYGRYAPKLAELVVGDEFETLDKCFWETIPFGTGGRRGPMAGFGSATINERTIAESAHGLAAYLKRQKGSAGGRGVVACDTRNRSIEFAKLTATTLAAHGLKVYFFPEPRSTPELSFAVRHLKCDVGAMISASHNPPSDNGFKAYWESGAQVLPPHDKGIIECVYEAGEIPTIDFDEAVAAGKIQLIGEEIDKAYVSRVVGLGLSDAREIPAVFTPLHGVGETSVWRIMQEAGFQGIEIFEPQRTPDGNFTNVPDHLPNPERREVFEPAIASAAKSGAELILASDPDADRLGAAVRGANGKFVHLTGNRIGALVADHILRKRAALGTLSIEHYVVETLVTTPLIGAIAKAHGVRAIDDLLVGFKYIAQTMDAEGPEKFVFGAEESLGYLAGSYCRDKDAAVAALYLLELAAELRLEGKTLLDRLDDLYRELGYFVEGQRSEVCEGSRGKEQIDGLMKKFREAPPRKLAGVSVARIRDYKLGEVRNQPGNKRAEELSGPKGDLLFLDSAVENGRRFSIAVRPSGTEPKIKFYFFGQAVSAEPSAIDDLKKNTDSAMSALQTALSKWVRRVIAELK